MTTYAIDDENSNELAAGVPQHEIEQVSQMWANKLGRPVYYYEMFVEDAESRQILPTTNA